MTLNHSLVMAKDAEPSKWLLVLHGIFGSGRNWGSLARRLVEERPEWGALLVDLRLHGGSTGIPGPHTLEATAADVGQLVSELDIDAAAVLGHSFGGKVALLYTRDHSRGLKQTWVMDSTLGVGEPRGSTWAMIDIVKALPRDFGSRDELADAIAQHGYARTLGQWLAMNLERSEDGRFRWRLDWAGVEEMLRDYFRADVRGVIESPPAGVEIRIVKATESESIPAGDVEWIERVGRRNGRVQLHEVTGGHWINIDNPDAVLALLSRHLP